MKKLLLLRPLSAWLIASRNFKNVNLIDTWLDMSGNFRSMNLLESWKTTWPAGEGLIEIWRNQSNGARSKDVFKHWTSSRDKNKIGITDLLRWWRAAGEGPLEAQSPLLQWADRQKLTPQQGQWYWSQDLKPLEGGKAR